MSFLRTLLFVLFFAATAPAQEGAELVGRWTGADEDNAGMELVFEKDVLVATGLRTPYSITQPGRLSLGDPMFIVLTYEVQGERLTLRWQAIRKEESHFRRVDSPAEEPGKRSESTRDPLARTFAGKGIVLVLRGTAQEGYVGQLGLAEVLHPVEAKLDGERLRGTFGAAANARAFEATLQGDELTLTIGNERYTLQGEPLPPPELEGVYEGRTRRFEHPRGWFGLDLPRGWSVGAQGDEGLWFDLGLPPNEPPEAIAGLLWGRLTEEEQNRPVAELLEKNIPTLRQALRDQGLIIRDPEGPIRTYRGVDVPGAVALFRGRTTTGVPCVVWCGTVLKRYSWLTVSGVFAAEKEDTYLPRLKRIFVSLEPRPPERNPELEARLVGKAFSSSQYGRITKSAHHATYTFAGNNVVHRRLMSNIISQPGLPGSTTDSERSGRYEVCGDVLFLFFETGQVAGHVLLEGQEVVGFRIGGAHYR